MTINANNVAMWVFDFFGPIKPPKSKSIYVEELLKIPFEKKLHN